MKSFYPSAVVGLLLLTLGCEVPIDFPDGNLKLPDLNLEGQLRYCQALQNEMLSTLDIQKFCTFESIHLPPDEKPFTWKNQQELESICDDYFEEWSENPSHYLHKPCLGFPGFDTPPDPSKGDPDSLGGECRAARMRCEDRFAIALESIAFVKNTTCGSVPWFCDVSVKDARACNQALLDESIATYSDLTLSCEPDNWHKVWDRKKDLEKRAEKERKLPSACMAMEKCIK